METLHFFSDYLARKYGKALQRIPVDPGFSCPHRLPSGKGGCAFCSASGSRARHLHEGMSIREQVERGLEYVRQRYHAQGPYIAYFQAFTGTNADVETLRKTYLEVLGMADFKVLIVATRPDCLPDECLDLLQELGRTYEVWIELGVQSANDRTLRKINRGHDFACVESAAVRLHERGIHTAAHLILGLPGESCEDYLETAGRISRLPFEAVKIHNLLILRKTPMAKMLEAGEVTPLNEYEYASCLCKVVRILPESMLLMRLSADADDPQVLAPKWWMRKSQFLEMFQRMFESGGSASRFSPCRTLDGSYTLYHPLYRQHFHSLAGAREESVRKYVEPCGLAGLLERKQAVHLLDVGFGLGCNVSCAVRCAQETAKGFLHVTALELDANVLEAALTLPEQGGERGILRALKDRGIYRSEFAEVRLLLGDARRTVRTLRTPFDLVFLDGFSPDVNPELWTCDFLLQLKRLMMYPHARLASYSSAYPFLGALLEAGFHVHQSEPFGRKRGGTVAALEPLTDLSALAQKDHEITVRSTAGIPYRDPLLAWDRSLIQSFRKCEVALRRAEGMPKWFRQN